MSLLRPKGDGHITDLLSAYIDQQISPAERAEVDSHLVTCPACRRDLQTLQWTVSLVRAVPQRPVPRSFTLPVPAAAPERTRHFSLHWSYNFLRAATAVATMFLVLVVSGDLLTRTSTFTAPAPALAPMSQPDALEEKAAELAAEPTRAAFAAEAPQAAAATSAEAKQSRAQADAVPSATQAAAVAGAPAAPLTQLPAPPALSGTPVPGGVAAPMAAAPPRVLEPTMTREGESITRPAPLTTTSTPVLLATETPAVRLADRAGRELPPSQPARPPDLVRLAEAGLIALTLILGLTTLAVRYRLKHESHP
ncbi:MAG: hypothetical protein A2Z04_07180 [Chloroflexi bacterium RBG_16_57_9]|nr:MAG: hypothetical protein A2Z04_07180 [Chloroflexi bacterium RBG_16_57_9]